MGVEKKKIFFSIFFFYSDLSSVIHGRVTARMGTSQTNLEDRIGGCEVLGILFLVDIPGFRPEDGIYIKLKAT